MTAERPVTRETLGAWLLRCNPARWDVRRFRADGHTYLARWDVYPTYRLPLMQAGDPVVFWLSAGDSRWAASGGRRALPSGIWSVGHLTGPVSDDVPDPLNQQAYWIHEHDATARSLSGRQRVPVHLPFLPVPLTAAALSRIDGLDDLEVVRAAPNSNPSYLTVREWELLQAHLPVLSDADPSLKRDDAVEKAAIEAVRAELENDPTGTWKVQSVEDEDLGWDLTARRNGVFRFIEVKGRGPRALTVLLTRHELQVARDEPSWELAVVPDALGEARVLWFERQTALELAQPTGYQLTLTESRARPTSA